jgi:hypothetical protein
MQAALFKAAQHSDFLRDIHGIPRLASFLLGFLTVFLDCCRRVSVRAVPVCRPGQQLDIDLFVCKACTGNTISLGGKPANGPYQPFCVECPAFMAAVNHTVCLDGKVDLTQATAHGSQPTSKCAPLFALM